MNIIEVAEQAKELMQSQKTYCPICGEKQFAPFDKLYVVTYGNCVSCETDIDKLMDNSENIFAIINSV